MLNKLKIEGAGQMAMDDRKQRVLQAIVALYGLEGEPVGSGLLADYLNMAVSSATLRNEMASLTKLGLLEQPHTSAGRVPSAKGYRYYLDHLLPRQTLSRAARRQVEQVFDSLDQEPERLAQGAARALSAMTGYTAVVAMPRSDDLCIAHYEVVQVGRSTAAVLAVTSAGYVRTRVARTGRGLTRQTAAAVAGLLNQNLTFIVPADVTAPMVNALCAAAGPELAPVVQAAAAILRDSAKPHTFSSGEQLLLNRPELQRHLPALLQLLNNEEALGRVIAPVGDKATVVLGEDLPQPMPGVSIVSRRYLTGGGLTGSVALIGSIRMPFAELIPLLELFAAQLGLSMSGTPKEE